MPEPNRRPPWRIADGLGPWAVWQLVDQRVVLAIACDSCPHAARWGPDQLRRRFRRHQGRTIAWIAPRLRCSKCRSEWIRISLANVAPATKRPEWW